MNEEFCKVTRKKWIAHRGLQRRTRRISDKSYDKDCPDVDVDKFVKKLEATCQQMQDSDYFAQSLATLKESLCKLQTDNKPETLKRLVCFGIGPFTRNFQALHQLAFILSLQKEYQITEAFYFDPIFRQSEKEVLEKFNCLVMSENCEAKYEADIQTLFYMPHCPNCLTNNLLWKNWQGKYLKNIILINNSFESLACSKPERLLRLDSSYILDIMPYAQELPLEDDYEVHNVFNDLSIHIFPESDLPEKTAEFWVEKEAPTYNDVEMISAADFAKLSLE
ncbi:SRR1-like protein [Lucilia sericata]|uniref:SRR1-like protein n=1 Tax=Lucilia sericata TaxID=13632 RepID=UPI0018A847CF|nr:SRR1-like protein [Lucilia sericata]